MARVTLAEAAGPGGQDLAGVDAAVVAMERAGFHLDVDYCARTAETARAAEAEHLASLRALVDPLVLSPPPDLDTVWSSQKKMLELLHGKAYLGLPPSPIWKKGEVKFRAGERKADEVALAYLGAHHPEVRSLLQGVVALRRTRNAIKYLEKLPQFVAPDGRVHAVFGPASDDDARFGAITWRLAAKIPEIHQLPHTAEKDPFAIRRAIVAPPGRRLVVADYPAMEMLIMAHLVECLFGDTSLSEMLAPGAPNFHSVTARGIFGEELGWSTPEGVFVRDLPLEAFKVDRSYPAHLRFLAKSVFFGRQYLKGAFGFGHSLLTPAGDPIGEAAAGPICAAMDARVPAMPRFQAWALEYIRRHKGIPGLAGAWCDLRALVESGDEWALAKAHRKAANYPLQNGVAVVEGRAMVGITSHPRLRELGAQLVLQVHDENVVECAEGDVEEVGALLCNIMENAYPIRPRFRVSYSHAADYWSAK